MRRRDLLAVGVATAIASRARAAAPPVVLELFTSQVCSSCPPADALLGRLSQRPNVIALAWHVDYWDNLGWRDRFASRQATDRQRAYARALAGEVFTPALVVDGANIVVGSDASAVEKAIRVSSPLPVPVETSRTNEGLTVDIGPGPAEIRALSIIYDPERATDIGTGENGGSRLREYRIVREVEDLGEWDGARRGFKPRPASAGQGQVILVQARSLRIIGAADYKP